MCSTVAVNAKIDERAERDKKDSESDDLLHMKDLFTWWFSSECFLSVLLTHLGPPR